MAPDISHLAADIQQKAKTLAKNNEKDRQSLLHSARALINELETPSERIIRMIYSETAIWMATRVLIDLRIFNLLAESNTAKTAKQLAEASNADSGLVERLLKHIATEGFIHETGRDEYTANATTRLLARSDCAGAVKDMFNVVPVYGDFPAYAKETKYANPADKENTAWKYTHKNVGHYFDWLSKPENADRLDAFKEHMAFKTLGPKWFDSPDIMDGIFGGKNISREDVILIDVGGSSGYDILNFHAAHPDMSGRLILQDLPATIHSLDTKALASKGVEAIPHDFFTPQPVQNAKAYYLKMILHDWPNQECKKILENLKPALKAGYSRILLNEIVIPDVKAGWYETSLDLLMMIVHGSQERREKEWRELVESVEGLKVVKIWDVEGAVEKIVEIELVE